ncbi:MAG: hypothetical protein CBC13_07680 [Planctomycetia bacterium TMED53]|nr:MAG: hypothetical protein CBC13_07680 [Planctomycetia bacterium TMED53]
MPTLIKRLLLLSASSVLVISSLVGCAAQSTYVQAIGTWSSEPVVQDSSETVGNSRSVTESVWNSWRNKVQQTLKPAIHLTVYKDASYLLEVAGVTYEGQVYLASLLGEGIVVKTSIGSVEAQGRIRIIKGETMVIESESDELGTELTLHRVP